MEDFFVNAYGPVGNGKMWSANTSPSHVSPSEVPSSGASALACSNTGVSCNSPNTPNAEPPNGETNPILDVSFGLWYFETMDFDRFSIQSGL